MNKTSMSPLHLFLIKRYDFFYFEKYFVAFNFTFDLMNEIQRKRKLSNIPTCPFDKSLKQQQRRYSIFICVKIDI